jgi:hypothetical protein
MRISSSVQPVGAEKTTTGPAESDALRSLILFKTLGIPFPSTSRRLPPYFAIERAFLNVVSS